MNKYAYISGYLKGALKQVAIMLEHKVATQDILDFITHTQAEAQRQLNPLPKKTKKQGDGWGKKLVSLKVERKEQ